MKYYLGLDMGTSSLKALLMEEGGEIVGEGSVDYEYAAPAPGWTEMEPEIWYRAALEVMGKVLGLAEAGEILAIGVTGQMHTTVFLDNEGRSIRPALMWNDTRTLPQLAEIKWRLQWQDALAATAKIISTGSPALNLYWLKKEEPENFARLHKFLIGPDYLVYRLTGKFGTDYCEASTSALYDFAAASWSREMGSLLGLPEKIYPPIRGSSQRAGRLLPEIARRLGLSGEVEVVCGTGDNAAAAFANGLGRDCEAFLSLGTSGVLVHAAKSPDFSRPGKNIAFSREGETIEYLVQGVVQSAGRTLNWLMRDILKTDDYDGNISHVDIETLGEGSLLFYPHLMGEKTMYGDMSLRGAFLGLSEGTSRADLQVAVMEGIAFGVRELAEAMGIERKKLYPLLVTGGGARSRLWRQILADVLETPVAELPGKSGAAYGAALLAAGSFREGRGAADEKSLCRPRMKNVIAYRKKYRNYLRIHDAVKNVYSAD